MMDAANAMGGTPRCPHCGEEKERIPDERIPPRLRDELFCLNPDCTVAE